MNMVYFVLIAGVSWLCTGLLRRYALRRELLDIPNERSSHAFPTPRGGGLSVVLVSLLSFVLLLGQDSELVWALFGAGVAVALIGFVDDHGHIPARWRLLIHFFCAIWALFWLGGLPPLPVFGSIIDFGWFGDIFAVLYLVWLLNLYNFMDGIDGIASVEAIAVCLGGVILYSLFSVEAGLSTPLWVLIASVAGFLIWNFPKAKIFMGDAGSGFIGLVLGIFSIQAASVAPELFWAWLILLGVFVVDATLTLIRRILRGERFYEAHRSHAYQYASRMHKSHVPVTLAVGIITLCWLLPLSVLVAAGWIGGLLSMLVAYTPLIFLAIKFKAGAN